MTKKKDRDNMKNHDNKKTRKEQTVRYILRKTYICSVAKSKKAGAIKA